MYIYISVSEPIFLLLLTEVCYFTCSPVPLTYASFFEHLPCASIRCHYMLVLDFITSWAEIQDLSSHEGGEDLFIINCVIYLTKEKSTYMVLVYIQT